MLSILPPPCRAEPGVQAGAAACSAASLRFMQYGHSSKTIFRVTLSSGNPGLRLSPNREQKENCHVNILADSNLLLFSFFPRVVCKIRLFLPALPDETAVQHSS